MLFFCMITPVGVYAQDGLPSVTTSEVPVLTNELPSTSYLKKEKRSIANTTSTSAIVSSAQTFGTLSTTWDDPYMPGNEETSGAGNVGSTAPLDSATLPIVLSILLLYIVYKGLCSSRKRNHF